MLLLRGQQLPARWPGQVLRYCKCFLPARPLFSPWQVHRPRFGQQRLNSRSAHAGKCAIHEGARRTEALECRVCFFQSLSYTLMYMMYMSGRQLRIHEGDTQARAVDKKPSFWTSWGESCVALLCRLSPTQPELLLHSCIAMRCQASVCVCVCERAIEHAFVMCKPS